MTAKEQPAAPSRQAEAKDEEATAELLKQRKARHHAQAERMKRDLKELHRQEMAREEMQKNADAQRGS